jgi:hypothetical protein
MSAASPLSFLLSSIYNKENCVMRCLFIFERDTTTPSLASNKRRMDGFIRFRDFRYFFLAIDDDVLSRIMFSPVIYVIKTNLALSSHFSVFCSLFEVLLSIFRRPIIDAILHEEI